MNSRAIVIAIFGALVLAGCNTVDSRIREKSAVFDQMPPADQAKVRQGTIAVGFTPDMVYMALGRPDAIRQRTSTGPQETVWIYSEYYERYVGTVRAGYRRWSYFDRRLHAYRIYDEPVYGHVYAAQREVTFRVTYTNGRVSAFEEAKS
jgi:hypothetical protein